MQFLHDDEDPHRESYNNGDNFDLQSPVLSNYGSPTNDAILPYSSVDKVRSALNAPLPNSFNPSSLSNIAKHGPMGSSVPIGFLRSPPNTGLSPGIVSPPSREPNIWATTGFDGVKTSPFPSSLLQTDLPNTQRILKSERNRPVRPTVVSASVPNQDWCETSIAEADLIPTDLHKDVLTPQERARRLSRADYDLSGSIRDKEGLAIPRRSSNAGAQTLVGSPSRFKAMFEEQKRDKETKMSIGSPLRESWLSDDSPRVGMQISAVAQATSRTELNRAEPIESGSLINGVRMPSSSVRSSAFGRLDRTISSPGIRPQRIDEEFEGGLFEMDDESTKRHPWSDNQSLNPGLRQLSNDIPRPGFGNGPRPIFGAFPPN